MLNSLFGVGDLDLPSFANLVVTQGLEMQRFVEPSVDDNFCVIDGTETMNLVRLHAKFLSLPRRARMDFIRTTVLAPLPDIPETWEQKQRSLVPVIRDGAYLAIGELQAKLWSKDEALPFVYRELAPGLYIQLVIDTPDKMLCLDGTTLAQANVTFEAALEGARANLRARSRDAWIEIEPGLWEAPWRDSYTATRAQLPDVLQRVCPECDLLVALPTRDRLLVSDMTRPGAYERIVRAVIETDRSAYAITSRIYCLSDGALRAYQPYQADEAIVAKHREIMLVDAQTNYEKERDLHRQLGTRDFFPNLAIYQSRATGEIITRATWTLGVGGYFPPAEAIHFVWLNEQNEVVVMWEAPWETVEEHAFLARTDSPFPRWKAAYEPGIEWLDQYAKRLAR